MKKEKMKGKDWWILIAAVIIVAVLASLVTVNLTGNTIRQNTNYYGKYELYTKAEVDTLLTKLSMPRYARCTSIGVDGGTGDSACAIENKTCKFGFKIWSRHNESDFGTEGPITDVIPVVSDCSTNWGITEGQDQVINYLCC